MKLSIHRLLLAIFFTFTLVGCGQEVGTETTEAGGIPEVSVAPEPDKEATSSTTTPRRSEPPVSVVPQSSSPEGSAELLDRSAWSNPNDPSSDVGAVCWSRNEIAQFIIDSVPGVEAVEERAPSRYSTFDEALEAATDALSPYLQDFEGRDSLKFAIHFLEQLADAKESIGQSQLSDTEVVKIGSEYFAFEDYPGVEEYVAAATDKCARY